MDLHISWRSTNRLHRHKKKLFEINMGPSKCVPFATTVTIRFFMGLHNSQPTQVSLFCQDVGFFNIVSQNVGVVPTLLELARLAHGLVPLFAVRVRRVRFRSRGGARLAPILSTTQQTNFLLKHTVLSLSKTLNVLHLREQKKCTTMVLLLWFKHES